MMEHSSTQYRTDESVTHPTSDGGAVVVAHHKNQDKCSTTTLQRTKSSSPVQTNTSFSMELSPCDDDIDDGHRYVFNLPLGEEPSRSAMMVQNGHIDNCWVSNIMENGTRIGTTTANHPPGHTSSTTNKYRNDGTGTD